MVTNMGNIDKWIVEFVSQYGDKWTRSIHEYQIPNYIGDRKYNGEFGYWLKQHFKISASTRINQLWRE